MTTKRLLLFVLCVILISFVLFENFLDVGDSKLFIDQSLIKSKENFDLNFADKIKNVFQELNDTRQNQNLDTKDHSNKGTIYRSRRAIDASSSIESSLGKISQQTAPEKHSRKSLKTKNKFREKGHKTFPNITSRDGICPSIDIRNNVSVLEILRDCRVIEGFLQIVLIEKFDDSDFQKYEFKKLREITGYLLLYRVNGLKSLNRLFPNLEVIRGDTLLADYAFMIYELQNLQEIGLNKLTEISRGAVRIEKNPSLCYTTTLDWNAIVVAGENTIKDNQNKSPCPGCPQCPGEHCWAAQLCQETHKPEKCHEQCLGDCKGPSDSDCYVCKHFRYEGKCVEKCPPNLYSYLSRRCITKTECYQISKTRKSHEEQLQKWRPINQSCVTQCPDGFEDYLNDQNMTSCRVCEGRGCRKITNGAIIHHISDAQIFRGITVINGALEFQIRSGNPNIMNELTDAFGQIEEITHYLKITHSFPITSLSFFKKLKIIRGVKLDMNNSSLIVFDNPNLTDLFGKNQRIQILKGKFFFHYNSKLCLQKIYDLSKDSGIPYPSELEVQPESNGDKVACEIIAINLTVSSLSSEYAILDWNSYTPNANQFLLSYLLNYIETESTNVTYEGNSCGNNAWQIQDVDIPNGNSTNQITISKKITNLKPYTNYAVYVKTFTARGKDKEFSSVVGQSKIIYFRTKSDIPSIPTNVVSFPVSDNEIVVNWNPPEEPNGPIAYYIVSGYKYPDDEELASTRNYCEHGLVFEPELEPGEFPEITMKSFEAESSSCCSTNSETKITVPKKFEIFCHEGTSISHLSPGRKNYCHSDRHGLSESGFPGFYNYSPDNFVFNVSVNSNSYKLKDLRHFTSYIIFVAACGHYRENGKPMCSQTVYSTTRTNSLPDADNVRNIRAREFSYNNSSSVIIYWDSAREPNGITVSYTVEYINTHIKNAKRVAECVLVKQYREKHRLHEIKDLSHGNYSFRVRSTSLAGDGEFSEAVHVIIGLKEDNSMTIVILLSSALLLTIAVFVYLLVRNYRNRNTQERLIISVNPDYMESKYIIDEWEIPRDNVTMLEELGVGNFGMVYRGTMYGSINVAIKTIPGIISEREKNDFLNEASVMKNFVSTHIIKLLGVVSVGTPPLVIMELMDHGDLKSYLRQVRDTKDAPDNSKIIRMAAEIADGMAYLESKKFVHRDLAARNCMVSGDLVCKVGDFGLARDIYETDYYKVGRNEFLPIRWMAPENLSDGVFTSDSDVWSYAVVLYEIFTLAEIPYQGYSNEEVLNYVLEKQTLNIPQNCPDYMIKLMERCFRWRPIERPTFMEIVGELEPFLGQDFCEKSFYHSEEGVEIRRLGIKKTHQHPAQIRFNWKNETARWVKGFEDDVSLLDSAGPSNIRSRIFKNGFEQFGNTTNLEEVPLDR